MLGVAVCERKIRPLIVPVGRQVYPVFPVRGTGRIQAKSRILNIILMHVDENEQLARLWSFDFEIVRKRKRLIAVDGSAHVVTARPQAANGNTAAIFNW